MPQRLRWYESDVVYEVTTRTIQERFLLRPSPLVTALILGVIARAQTFYTSVKIYGFTFLSNHYHMLLSAGDGAEIAKFLGYVNSNIAREMGRVHKWRGSLWGRRAKVIPILDSQAMIERLRYVISNGVKEGLVASPREWPGASGVPGLLGNMTLSGIWIDRDRLRRARRRDPNADAAAFTSALELTLSPLPVWSDLSASDLREKHEVLVQDVERDARERGGKVLGAERVMKQNPHDAPKQPARGPAPQCHTSSPLIRDAFRRLYAAFQTLFRTCADARKGQPPHEMGFPPGSFPRPAWFSSSKDESVLRNLALDVAMQRAVRPAI
ncbi:MAG: transposase [Kofleriaceae bacterium]